MERVATEYLIEMRLSHGDWLYVKTVLDRSTASAELRKLHAAHRCPFRIIERRLVDKIIEEVPIDEL